MTQLLSIAVCGAAGAVARYLLTAWVASWFNHWLPAGTFVVNMAGCFLIGLLFQLSVRMDLLSADVRLAVGVGFLGGLTTFSTFGLETYVTLEEGRWYIAAANVVANVVVGLIAVWAGMALAKNAFGGE